MGSLVRQPSVALAPHETEKCHHTYIRSTHFVLTPMLPEARLLFLSASTAPAAAAAPLRSGTVLEHPGHPALAVTVHLASLPLESLSRGVDRSFAGAPPLRLAAFRRLLDRRGRYRHRPSAVPPRSNNQGVGDGRHEHAGGGVVQEPGYGGGTVHGVEGSNDSSSGGTGELKSYDGRLEGGEAVDAGGKAAGHGDRELALEQAGYLIEVRVMPVTPHH